MTIANETIKTEGTMNVRGRASFATQTSFCFSETLQKNVTFGTKFDQARYDTVIDACALRTDLKQLEGGDQIVLGERGINLSGGQKARVGLARAVYAPSQIILLDDVLSAVDSHVGDHIFEHCLKDYLVGTESRTVIFATNQLHRLQHADRILFIENGKIEGQATTLDELLEKNVKFRQMMDRGGQKQTNSQEEQVLHAAEEATGDTVTDASAAVAASTTEQKEQEGGSRLRRRTTSGDSNISSSRAASTLSEDSQGRNKSKIESGNKPILLHLEEEKQIGHVSSDTYKFYCEQAGYVFLCFAIFGVGLQLYINIGAQFWLGIWTTSVGLRNYTNVTTVEQQIYLDVDSRMIGIYAGIMFASFVSMLFGAYLFARVRVKVARNTHSDMLKRVASAPVSFFDVTPLGRILNRFSSDQKSVDFVLTIMVMWSCVAGNMLLSAFLAMTIGTGGGRYHLKLFCCCWLSVSTDQDTDINHSFNLLN
jgi:ABC-type multidrug transport system fused ATPase/permease subunit